MARATSRWPTANGGARRWHLTASFFSSITAVSTTPVRPGRHWVQRTASNGITGSRTRSEEHTSELQSLMRNSYAVFCLKKKKEYKNNINIHLQSTIKTS